MPQEPYREADFIDVSGNGLRFAMGQEPVETPSSLTTFSAPSRGVATAFSPTFGASWGIAGIGNNAMELPPGVDILEDSTSASFQVAYINVKGQTVNASFSTDDPEVLKDLKEAKKWNQEYGDKIVIYWNDDPLTKYKTITAAKHTTKTK